MLMSLNEILEDVDISYEGFKAFVYARDPSTAISNKNPDTGLPSWDFCSFGEYLKSLGVTKSLDQNNATEEELLEFLFYLNRKIPNDLHYQLRISTFKTYGELQDYLKRTSEYVYNPRRKVK